MDERRFAERFVEGERVDFRGRSMRDHLQVQHLIASGYINAGPDIYRLTKKTEVVRDADVKIFSGMALSSRERLWEIVKQTYGGMGDLDVPAECIHKVTARLLDAVNGIAERKPLLSPKSTVTGRDLEDLGISLIGGGINDDEKVTVEGDEYDFSKPVQERRGINLTHGIVLPANFDIEAVIREFEKEQFFELRGEDGGEFDRLRHGVKVDLGLLRMFEDFSQEGAIVASSHARASNAVTETANPKRVCLFDDAYISGDYQRKPNISLQQAFSRGVPFMDLPAFLSLFLDPKCVALKHNMHPVVLNHFLPNGDVVRAAWGGGWLYLNSSPVESSKTFRVIPAV